MLAIAMRKLNTPGKANNIFYCLLLLKYSASKTNSTRQRTKLAMNIRQKNYNNISCIGKIIVVVIFVPQHSCI